MNIEALINLHISRTRTPIVPESLEVVLWHYRLQAQAALDASPVWRRGL